MKNCLNCGKSICKVSLRCKSCVLLKNKRAKNHIPWNKGKRGLQKAWNNQQIRKTCVYCHHSFMISPSRQEKAKYCNKKCFYSNLKTIRNNKSYKEKISNAVKKRWLDQNYYNKHVRKIKKVCIYCKKQFLVSLSGVRIKCCSQSCARLLMWGKKSYKEKASIRTITQWNNIQYREKMSRLMKNRWQDKKWREETLFKILHRTIIKPTSLEQQMITLIKKYNLPYKYTGNGDFWIGGKNPDFVNINGEKKLIEVGNVYHHQGNYINRRKKHFAKYGWKSFIFIGNRLDREEILKILT